MPIEGGRPVVPDGIAGTRLVDETPVLSSRWLMAYAASVGETGQAYFDTTGVDNLAVHPLFPVCYEWPAWRELTARVLPESIARRGVHTAHELVRHRAVPVGGRLSVAAELELVLPRDGGVSFCAKLEACDDADRPVSTTRVEWFCPGVAGHRQVVGGSADESPRPERPRRVDGEHPAWSETVDVTAGAAHVYTECARIHNPIHTDRAVAERAGLPAPILHGTATLAMALSAALQQSRFDPFAFAGRVRAVFRKPVIPPAELSVEGYRGSAPAIVVRRADGEAALNAEIE